MAQIEKRGEGTYRLTVEAGFDANGKRKRYRKTVKAKSSKEAEKLWSIFYAEVQSGTYITPEKMTFETFVTKEWLKKFAESNYSPTTLRKYTGQLHAHILPVIGHKKLDDIKPLHLVTYLKELEQDGSRKDGREGNLSAATIKDIYKIMKSVFNKAEEWKVIKNNPMDGVDQPKVERKKMKYYTAEEAAEVIDALYQEQEQWKIYFLGAMLGGFRRGELTALEWSDVDFENNTITIRKSVALTKNGQAIVKDPKTEESIRTVDMPSWYMEELKKYYRNWMKERLQIGDMWQGGDHQYVFHGGYGKPYYFTVPTEQWKRILKRHGLKQIRLHDLRHTAGTLLIERGIAKGMDADITLKAVQERLGHRDLKTTADIYGHITKKASKALAEQLEDFDPRKNAPKMPPKSV